MLWAFITCFFTHTNSYISQDMPYKWTGHRVSKCRRRGGQRPRKFVVDSRKNLSKICKSTNFRLFV